LVYLALILPIASRQDTIYLEIGGVATRDILSPSNITFESRVLTDKALSETLNAVSPKYLPADTSINRNQIDELNRVLDFVNSIREDQYSTKPQKIRDLLSQNSIALTENNASALVGYSDEEWLLVRNESVRVLEETMRSNIKDYQVQEIKNGIPGLIDYSIPSPQIDMITTLTSPFVTANALYSEDETAQAKQAATNLVKPVIKTYAQDQIVVLRGQIITEEHWEALNKLGLIRSNSILENNISSISIVALMSIFVTVYFARKKTSPFVDIRALFIISLGFVFFLFLARIAIPNRAIIPYMFPLAAYALIIVSLFSFEVSIIFSLLLSILVTHGNGSPIELTIFYILSSLVGAVILSRGRTFINFIWASLAISIAGLFLITSYRFINPTTDIIGLVTLYGAVVVNGLASASIALLAHYLLSQILRIPTPMYLIELSRSDHPLLQQILKFAPGTYQHSLQVANLAEQAAAAIGADALLTRVGTYFHDAGKTVNPSFFIENQVPGNIDSHDQLDPVIAAQTIISHVNDGVKLSNKHHLPPRIRDFILEHHGTQLTKYQYSRAVELVNNQPELVDAELFRYPGPKPRSKETAILMLADICEAKARSKKPKDESEISDLIQSVIDMLLKEGSLENSTLTLRDITTIRNTFLHTLSNTYHPRIQYPEEKKEEGN
jgi:putative nucleotidyltransferase with HDIG domain